MQKAEYRALSTFKKR